MNVLLMAIIYALAWITFGLFCIYGAIGIIWGWIAILNFAVKALLRSRSDSDS